MLIDLDEAETLDRELRWFGHNRFNLFSFHDADHAPDDGSGLRDWAERLGREVGADISGGAIRILALPRVLGYVFNPISEWYCYDRTGELKLVIHEVRNTFGDRHWYVFRPDGDLSHVADKRMHVSPFMPMDQRYTFTVTPPGARAGIGIRQYDAGGEIFRASLVASRRPLDDATLLRTFARRPFLTLGVTMAIHVHALRLWRKRVPWFRRPEPPTRAVTVAAAHSKDPTP